MPKGIPEGCMCMWQRQPDNTWKLVYSNHRCPVHYKQCSHCGGLGRVPQEGPTVA